MFRRTVQLASVLALASGLGAPALASTARLAALGGDGFVLDDPAAARTWYGALADHAGWAAVESGAFAHDDGYPRDGGGWRSAGPGAGLNWAIGEHGRHAVAGLWWHERAAAGGGGELGGDGLAGSWQVLVGRAFGSAAATLAVRHADTDREVAGDLRRDASRDEFGLGLRWELSPRAYVDAAAELVRLQDASVPAGGESVTRSTAGSWSGRARAFIGLGERVVLTPALEHRLEDRDWDAAGGPDDRTWRMWRAAAALTWLPDPDHLVLAAVDRSDSREERRDGGPAALALDATVTDLRLAVEARVHALLSVRLAAGYRVTDVAFDGADLGRRHELPLAIGLAAHLGPADLEIALANLPPTGPDGLREPWTPDDGPTWLQAGLNWWF